jgi:hypothetical protein
MSTSRIIIREKRILHFLSSLSLSLFFLWGSQFCSVLPSQSVSTHISICKDLMHRKSGERTDRRKGNECKRENERDRREKQKSRSIYLRSVKNEERPRTALIAFLSSEQTSKTLCFQRHFFSHSQDEDEKKNRETRVSPSFASSSPLSIKEGKGIIS